MNTATIRPSVTLLAVLALVASLMGPLARRAEAAGETIFGANPSSASGPGTIVSDRSDGTDEVFRFVARATNVDGTEQVRVLVDDGDPGTATNFTIALALVPGTAHTYAATWDIPDGADTGSGHVTFQVVDGSTVLAEHALTAKIEPSTYGVSITPPTMVGTVAFSGGAATISGTASSGANSVAIYYSTSPAGASITWTQCGSTTTSPAAGHETFSGACTLADGDAGSAVTLIGVQASTTGQQGSGDVLRVNPNASPDAVDDAYATAEDTALSMSAPGVLANDSDPEGDPLTVAVESGPANGTLTLNSDGSFSYTPDVDFNGSDPFTYRASDPLGNSDVATVTITVNAVNDPPVANDDSHTTQEETTLTVTAPGVLGNDTDVDSDPLSAVLVTGPTGGTLTLNSDGSFTYAPDVDFNGSDSFTYRANDGTEDSNVATVSITVTSLNDVPTAADDSHSTAEETTLTVSAPGVLGNDVDVDGDPLTAVLDTDVSNGTLTLNSDGSFTYTPDVDFHGTDSFTYHANDGTADSSVATVTVTVTPVNDDPVAVDDAHSTDEDLSLNVPAPGVLGNDTDVDGDALATVLVDDVANGTLDLNADGSFTYTPDVDFHGTDTFTYQADDGTAQSNVATVTITVDPVNDAPAAMDDGYDTDQDTTLNVAAPGVLADDTDVDGDALTAVLDTDVANGTLTLDDDGSFTYDPDPGFTGSDSFTYHANDGLADSNVATVTITVNNVNDAPVATDDTGTTDEDTPLVVAAPGVLGNDSDVDGDALATVLVDDVANGTLDLNADGSFTYTPDADFHGTDTFTYQADDGTAQSNVATVTITVDPVNDAPVANDDAYTTSEDTARTVVAPGVLGDDTDADGDPLTAVLVGGVANGTLTFNTDGSFTYTPDADFHGTDTFTYRANDGTADSDLATVTITVNPVNDAPVANDDTATTDEDTAVGGNVLTNDSDVDGAGLTAGLDSDVSNGTLTLNSDGSFTYTPDADFHGTDTFTYHANDGTADSNVATVTITVNAVNDPPVANDDAYSVQEDTLRHVGAPNGVLADDTDPEGDTLTAALVAGPSHGTLTLDADGSFTYTPDADFHGTDTFTYRANDGTTDSNIATVTITVSAVNDPPVAADDSYSVGEGGELNVGSSRRVLANDDDTDGDALAASVTAGPDHGTLTLHPDGTFTYRPAAGFSGTDSFTYQASDGSLSDTATVTITVTAAPTPPEDGAVDPETTIDTVERLAGDDRYQTAKEVSRESFPEDGSADAVVLARGDDPSGFADALAGAPLAVDLNAPILITLPGTLVEETERELTRVLPEGGTVVMLGLTAALHPEVEARVRALGYEVERIGGATRMETAIEIAEKLGNPDKLLIARGWEFPDALAAGAAAAHVGGAVLLGDDGFRNASTEAYLSQHPDAQRWAIGGQMARLYTEATPVFGADRIATAVEVAEEFFTAPSAVGLARSDKFPDSLTGGAHIGRLGGPMLLTFPAPEGVIAAPVKDHLCDNASSITEAYVYGGHLAVSLGVETELLGRISGSC